MLWQRAQVVVVLAAVGVVGCSSSGPLEAHAGAPVAMPSAGRDAGQGGAGATAGQSALGGAAGSEASGAAGVGGAAPSGSGAATGVAGSPGGGVGRGSAAGAAGAGGGSASTVGLGGCQLSKQLHADDFSAGMARWVSELEAPAASHVSVKGEQLDIDAAEGATVWFSPLLEGNLLIDYDVTVVMQGGANDHLTDLNSFWMATDPKNANLFTRSGAFAQYNDLLLYYVGFGGSANTTTRIRRYDGNATRPEPLGEYLDALHLLVANHAYHLQHVVCGKHVAYVVDGAAYFELDDPSPYTSGRFGFRTVGSHESIDNFSVYQLLPP